MNDDWLLIEDYPLPEFDPATWYRLGEQVLIWDGWCRIANYSYTQKGKGRWRDWRGIVTPTHWMPLPGEPKDSL